MPCTAFFNGLLGRDKECAKVMRFPRYLVLSFVLSLSRDLSFAAAYANDQSAQNASAMASSADPLAVLVRQVRKEPEAYTYSQLALAVARELYPDLRDAEAAAFEKELDRLSEKLKATLQNPSGGREVVERVNKLLFVEVGLQTPRQTAAGKENPDHYFPHTVLARKQGVCLGLCLVYLALTERAGLPFRAAHAAQHIYMRYDEGPHQINIETTAGGRSFDVTTAPGYQQLSQDALHGKTYFRALGKLEVLADLLNAAAWCSAVGTAPKPLAPARALLAARLCVELGPDDYSNWDTLSRAELYAGAPHQAHRSLQKALGMQPPDVGAYDRTYWEGRLQETRAALAKKIPPPGDLPIAAPPGPP